MHSGAVLCLHLFRSLDSPEDGHEDNLNSDAGTLTDKKINK